METIICNLNMFDMNQHVYKHNNNTKDFIPLADVPISKLAKTITAQCCTFGINSVHLYGDEVFLEPIIEDIKICSKTEYKLDDIKVEVN